MTNLGPSLRAEGEAIQGARTTDRLHGIAPRVSSIAPRPATIRLLRLDRRTFTCARMPSELPLRCRCGRLRGIARDVGPATGLRFVCYCEDCQAFARFLERPDILDPAGGTDIFQMPPARMTLTAGTDALRSLRLSDKGVLRWYADCCLTPIANTAGARFPLIAIIHSFMDHEADGRSRDEALGAPLCRIYERSAVGPLPPTAPPPSFAVFARRGSMMLGWWLRGLAKPSPFFDERTGAPRAKPRVLTEAERSGL
jgi:hypothetical protein